jgi:histidinol phosphatase-like PHP family hydrolase
MTSERLDLSDIYCKMATDIGVMVAISTDAHSVNEFDFMPTVYIRHVVAGSKQNMCLIPGVLKGCIRS